MKNTISLFKAILLVVLMFGWLSAGAVAQPQGPKADVPSTPEAPKTEEIEVVRDLSHHLTGGKPVSSSVDTHFDMGFGGHWGSEGNQELGAAEAFGLTIGLVAVVLGILSPFALLLAFVIVHYRSKVKMATIQRESIAKMVEAGQDVPLELFRGEKTDPQRYMRNGFRNLGLGAGLFIFLSLIAGVDVGSLGCVFMGVGLAQLATWKVASNDKAK